MNILFYLTRYPGVGGIENVTTVISSELMKYHRISILSHIQQGVNGLEGIELYVMPNSSNWNARENYDYAHKIMTDKQFDAIIYQDSYAPTEHIVCEISKAHHIPLIVFEHNSPLFIYNKRDLSPIYTPKGLLRRMLHPYLLWKEKKRKRYLLSHSKKYVMLSKQFIPEFCELIGAETSDNRITFINNPVAPVAESIDVEKDNIILCVSRLAKEKCVDRMLSIWSQLEMELPDWRFVIVGDGPERYNLESYVQNNQIPRVQFTGFAKPTEYYQKAKIFWMTSKYEGWGLTLVEAMQQGCVPVAFQTFSSIKDIIDDSVNGYLIEPGDEEMFKCKTLIVANGRNIRFALESACRKKVREFEVKRIILDWLKLIDM